MESGFHRSWTNGFPDVCKSLQYVLKTGSRVFGKQFPECVENSFLGIWKTVCMTCVRACDTFGKQFPGLTGAKMEELLFSITGRQSPGFRMAAHSPVGDRRRRTEEYAGWQLELMFPAVGTTAEDKASLPSLSKRFSPIALPMKLRLATGRQSFAILA
jgi:hypothetical protein